MICKINTFIINSYVIRTRELEEPEDRWISGPLCFFYITSAERGQRENRKRKDQNRKKKRGFA